MVKDKGGAQGVRAKTLPYAEVVRQGLITEGDVLRYVTKHGDLLGIGVAREKGIQIQPQEKPVGPTAFEAACGSKAHRPNEFTLIPDSLTLQETIARHIAGNDPWEPLTGKAAAQAAAKAAVQAQTHAAVAPTPFTDGMDDHCKLCGHGGELLCCEECPTVFHPACLGLPGVPDGDWHCPACRCACCGRGGFVGHLQPQPRGAAVGAAPDADPWPPVPGALVPPGAGACSSAQQQQQQQQRPLGHVPNYEEVAFQQSRARQRERGAAAAPPEPPLPPAPEAEGAAIPPGLLALEPPGPRAGAAAADIREVMCPGSGARFHAGCLPPEQLQEGAASSVGPWYSNDAARRASHYMASVCAAGPEALPGHEAGGAPLSWQLIRSAAVRSPQSCRGYYPAYSPQQRVWLRSVLSAALALMSSGLPPVRDAHSGRELLPLMLMGWSGGGTAGTVAGGGPATDFGAMHTAVLWAGSTLVAVAVVRVSCSSSGAGAAAGSSSGDGGAGGVAEVPFLVVRPELRGNGLGRLLLRCVEGCCLQAGASLMLMPAPVPVTVNAAAAAPPAAAAAQDAAAPEAALAVAVAAQPQEPRGGVVDPYSFALLNHSWAFHCGYRLATPQHRLAALLAGAVFPMKAPLAAKPLASADSLTPAEGLPFPGPLVMQEPSRWLSQLAQDQTAQYHPAHPAAAAAAAGQSAAATEGGGGAPAADAGPGVKLRLAVDEGRAEVVLKMAVEYSGLGVGGGSGLEQDDPMDEDNAAVPCTETAEADSKEGMDLDKEGVAIKPDPADDQLGPVPGNGVGPPAANGMGKVAGGLPDDIAACNGKHVPARLS